MLSLYLPCVSSMWAGALFGSLLCSQRVFAKYMSEWTQRIWSENFLCDKGQKPLKEIQTVSEQQWNHNPSSDSFVWLWAVILFEIDDSVCVILWSTVKPARWFVVLSKLKNSPLPASALFRKPLFWDQAGEFTHHQVFTTYFVLLKVQVHTVCKSTLDSPSLFLSPRSAHWALVLKGNSSYTASTTRIACRHHLKCPITSNSFFVPSLEQVWLK